MALVIPPDFFQAFIPYRHSGLARAAAVTIGIGTAPGVDDPQTVADDLLAAWESVWATPTDSQVTVGPVSLYFDQAGARGSVQGGDTFQGTNNAGDTTPPQVAMILNKVTARVGRPGRGRMYLPWTAGDGDVTETGVLTGAAQPVFQAFADQIISAMDTAREGMYPVILHNEGVPGGTTPSLITAFRVGNRSGTQGRRNRP
jgi:hypothetical protein